jgi:CheY-like chemotaxis protein
MPNIDEEYQEGSATMMKKRRRAVKLIWNLSQSASCKPHERAGSYLWSVPTLYKRTKLGTIFQKLTMASVGREVFVPKLMSAPECAQTVLVVEDDPFVRRGVCAVLREAGFGVVGAENAARAQAKLFFEGTDFDAIVCDAVLPDACGIELCKRLRVEAPQLRVILTSGYQAGMDDARFQESTNTRFLAKPYCGDELITTLRQIMAEPVEVREPLLPSAIADSLQDLPG